MKNACTKTSKTLILELQKQFHEHEINWLDVPMVLVKFVVVMKLIFYAFVCCQICLLCCSQGRGKDYGLNQCWASFCFKDTHQIWFSQGF